MTDLSFEGGGNVLRYGSVTKEHRKVLPKRVHVRQAQERSQYLSSNITHRQGEKHRQSELDRKSEREKVHEGRQKTNC